MSFCPSVGTDGVPHVRVLMDDFCNTCRNIALGSLIEKTRMNRETRKIYHTHPKRLQAKDLGEPES